MPTRRRRSSPSPPTPTSGSPTRSAGRRRTTATWGRTVTLAALTRLMKEVTAAMSTAAGEFGAGGAAAPGRERKSQNVDALVRGNLDVRRQPLILRILSVSDAAAIARKPFKPPSQNGYSENNEHLAWCLSARKRFVPWGSMQPFAVINNLLSSPAVASDDSLEKEEPLPPGIEPLILWQPEGCGKENSNFAAIEVDHLLVDGKLVPVESMVRLTTHQSNGMANSGEKEAGKISSPNKPGRQSLLGKNLKMMGFSLKNSSLGFLTKSRRTSPICLQGLNKTNPSSDHQPQN